MNKNHHREQSLFLSSPTIPLSLSPLSLSLTYPFLTPPPLPRVSPLKMTLKEFRSRVLLCTVWNSEPRMVLSSLSCSPLSSLVLSLDGTLTEPGSPSDAIVSRWHAVDWSPLRPPIHTRHTHYIHTHTHNDYFKLCSHFLNPPGWESDRIEKGSQDI